jgi:hypothetical protein
MLQRAAPDTTPKDVACALAFVLGLATVFLTLYSWAWCVPLAAVTIATAPRRSTRTVTWWAVVGVGIGLILLALALLLFASTAHSPRHD